MARPPGNNPHILRLRRELDALRNLLQSHVPAASSADQRRPQLGLFRFLPGFTDEDWAQLAPQLDAEAWMPLSIHTGEYPLLARVQADLQDRDAAPLPVPASPDRFRRVLNLELQRSRLDKTPLSLALLRVSGSPVPERIAAFLATRLHRHHLATLLGNGRLGLLMPGMGQGHSGDFLEGLLAALHALDAGIPRPCCGLASYRGVPELSADKMFALADTALTKACAAGAGRLERALAPLPMPRLQRTLVHANEKRFLLSGFRKDEV